MRLVLHKLLHTEAALKTPARNGYNAQGINLTFRDPFMPYSATDLHLAGDCGVAAALRAQALAHTRSWLQVAIRLAEEARKQSADAEQAVPALSEGCLSAARAVRAAESIFRILDLRPTMAVAVGQRALDAGGGGGPVAAASVAAAARASTAPAATAFVATAHVASVHAGSALAGVPGVAGAAEEEEEEDLEAMGAVKVLCERASALLENFEQAAARCVHMYIYIFICVCVYIDRPSHRNI